MAVARRGFLKTSAALAVGQTLRAQTTPERQALLPTIRLGKHDVTRLIVGSNPFYGYSHFTKLYDRQMAE